MANPEASKGKPAAGDVVCEPGRHLNCLHAKMAERRAAAKPR
jgi:hypothetical protein